MFHLWSMASDQLDYDVKTVMLDLLLQDQHMYGFPSQVVTWTATFLLDITPRVIVGHHYYCHFGHPKGVYRQERVLDETFPC